MHGNIWVLINFNIDIDLFTYASILNNTPLYSYY